MIALLLVIYAVKCFHIHSFQNNFVFKGGGHASENKVCTIAQAVKISHCPICDFQLIREANVEYIDFCFNPSSGWNTYNSNPIQSYFQIIFQSTTERAPPAML
jgi:hypothetical protein